MSSDESKSRFEVISEPGAAIKAKQMNPTEEEERGLSTNVRLSDIGKKPTPAPSKFRRALVRFAEWAGWLNDVPEDVVKEYLKKPESEFLKLFGDEDVRGIFIELAGWTRLSLNQICEMFPKLSRQTVKENLRRLEKANFIAKCENQISEDFDVYFLTEQGLRADRQLERFMNM